MLERQDLAAEALDRLPVGLALFDDELRYVHINERLAALNGLPAAEHLGRRLPEVLPALGHTEELLRHVLETGESLVDELVDGGTPSRPDLRWRATYFPLGDPPHGVGVVAEDVTAEQHVRGQAARRGAILEEVLARVPVGLIVNTVPDLRYLAVSDAAHELVRPRRELIGRTIPEAFPEIADLVDATYGEVLRTGRPLTHHDVPMPLGGPSAWEGQRYFDYSISPVRTGGEVVALLTVYTETTRQVRERAEYERRLAAEHEVAESFQRALLPDELPELPGLELAVTYEPAPTGFGVGGDFYDAFTDGDGRSVLVLGDVSGKGVQAASLSAFARYALRTASSFVSGPAELLRALNRTWMRDVRTGEFCTVAVAAVGGGPEERRLEVALAGHPAPVVFRSGGSAAPVGTAAPMIGLGPDLVPHVASTVLRPGDGLVLYSDGLTEARAPELVTEEELGRLVGAAAAAPVGDVLLETRRGAVGQVEALRDDLAMLAVRVARRDGLTGQ